LVHFDDFQRFHAIYLIKNFKNRHIGIVRAKYATGPDTSGFAVGCPCFSRTDVDPWATMLTPFHGLISFRTRSRLRTKYSSVPVVTARTVPAQIRSRKTCFVGDRSPSGEREYGKGNPQHSILVMVRYFPPIPGGAYSLSHTHVRIFIQSKTPATNIIKTAVLKCI
jgi:hypothetical protein